MKSHPHLLVRDALAELLVAAARGAPEARKSVETLAAWAQGSGPSPEILAEDGTALFEGVSMAPRFGELDGYVRDRARRMAAACEWIAADGVWGDTLACARAAWDAGLFFEVHEIVEPVWLEERGPKRPLLQGVIMAGAALHHLCQGNPAGARGLLGDAARKLVEGGADAELAAFGAGLLELRKGIESGAIQSVDDVSDLPRF